MALSSGDELFKGGRGGGRKEETVGAGVEGKIFWKREEVTVYKE